jgi:gamma-glutamyl-gamma-aminobutyrate hydrolase PuuD
MSIAIDETDNSIESLRHEKYPILGVMWHPERNPDENNKTILQYFFNELIHDR